MLWKWNNMELIFFWNFLTNYQKRHDEYENEILHLHISRFFNRKTKFCLHNDDGLEKSYLKFKNKGPWFLLQIYYIFLVVGQNVDRQNVDRQNVDRHNVEQTKFRTEKMSNRQNVDRQNAEQTKCRQFFYFFYHKKK